MAAAPSSKPSAAQSDFRRRTVLPSTLHNLRVSSSPAAGSAGALGEGLTSDEYLDKVEEELNRRVDADVESLVDGMRELVGLAKIDALHPPHPSITSQRALASQLRTEQMLRSAHSLLGLAHSLELLHLFGDGAAGTAVRETRERELRGEIERLKVRAAELAGGGEA
ncbi:hypothetical protein JCM10213_008951 [Rhodosporidiobolus nylandii]